MLIRASIPPSSLSQIGGRIARKRIHVRIEHVQHSKCRDDFLNRVKDNEKAKALAKKTGKKVNLKRINKQPRAGKTVKGKKTTFVCPQPYVIPV